MITPGRPVLRRDVARHYDALDAFYRELWGDHVHHGLWLTGRETPEQAVRQLADRVVQEAEIGPGSRVCDVGCGYGGTARLLVAERQARVTALTVSAHQHRYAEAQAVENGPSPVYLLQDWLRNAQSDAAFDAVLFIESLAHMDDKPHALAEAYRVLQPGGRLVACTWLAASEVPTWARRFLLEPICREGRLPGLPIAEEYHRWIAAAGFEEGCFEDLSVQVQRTWRIVIERVVRALLSRPAYRRYLLDWTQRDRSFVWTPLRLWLGFQTGMFCYGLFTARKPT